MRKVCLVGGFVLALVFTKPVSAQVEADTNALSSLDSMVLIRELAQLLGPPPVPAHSFYVGTSIGNRLFSIRNNRLNSRQDTRELVLSPQISYAHKSGLSLSGSVNLVNQPSGMDVTQWSITPAYDYRQDSGWSIGLAYTYFGVRDFFSAYSSPIQHDVFASASYQKWWLQPSLALGYSAGKYREFRSRDTVINSIRRFIYDSTTYNLRNLTVQVGFGHRFCWTNLAHPTDALLFTPSVLLLGSTGQTEIQHRTNAPLLLNALNRRARIPRLIQDKFAFESVGLSLDMQYMIGNWSISPQFYGDYYFGSTTGKRLTTNVQLGIGYFF